MCINQIHSSVYSNTVCCSLNMTIWHFCATFAVFYAVLLMELDIHTNLFFFLLYMNKTKKYDKTIIFQFRPRYTTKWNLQVLYHDNNKTDIEKEKKITYIKRQLSLSIIFRLCVGVYVFVKFYDFLCIDKFWGIPNFMCRRGVLAFRYLRKIWKCGIIHLSHLFKIYKCHILVIEK